MMGVTFGFGWTPCIGPVLGAVLTYTAVSAEGVLDGAVNLFLYAAGVGAPLLVVALLAQQGVRLLNRIKRFLPRIEKATGAVLVGMAVLMVTDSTSLLTFGVGDDASAGIGQRVVAAAKQADGSDGGAADGSKLLASVGDVGAAVADGGPACGAKATACGVAGADEPVFEPEAGWSTPTGQPTALYFFQPNCPACLEMTPIVRAMTATCAGKGMAVHRIDISQREQRSMAAQYGIRGTPTLVFVDDAGKEVSRLVGASDLGTVHDAIAVLMGQACARFTPM
jgi:cytochrome c-type biogenesis protein